MGQSVRFLPQSMLGRLWGQYDIFSFAGIYYFMVDT
jgi:hypothetical protein